MSEIEPSLIPDDVVAVCRRLQEAGHEAHLVGGGVRDLVLGREPKDFDVATSARPDAVMQLFGQRFAIPTGLQHGTVTVLTGARPVEVTTFRGEGVYLDGRRPSSVEFGKTLHEDLSRRDLTMNAIAYDPLAGACWPTRSTGAATSRRELVRAVGDPGGPLHARTACGPCGRSGRPPSWASPSIRPPAPPSRPPSARSARSRPNGSATSC